MSRQKGAFLLIVMGAGLMVGCGGTSPPAGPGDSNGDVIITITGIDGGNSFAPAAASVKIGQSVSWQNGDSTTHRVILTDVFDTGALGSGETSAGTRMTTADTYS